LQTPCFLFRPGKMPGGGAAPLPLVPCPPVSGRAPVKIPHRHPQLPGIPDGVKGAAPFPREKAADTVPSFLHQAAVPGQPASRFIALRRISPESPGSDSGAAGGLHRQEPQPHPAAGKRYSRFGKHPSGHRPTAGGLPSTGCLNSGDDPLLLVGGLFFLRLPGFRKLSRSSLPCENPRFIVNW
jgi:hypothetical protein